MASAPASSSAAGSIDGDDCGAGEIGHTRVVDADGPAAAAATAASRPWPACGPCSSARGAWRPDRRPRSRAGAAVTRGSALGRSRRAATRSRERSCSTRRGRLGRVLGAVVGTLDVRDVVLVGPHDWSSGRLARPRSSRETRRSALPLLVERQPHPLGTVGAGRRRAWRRRHADVVGAGPRARGMTRRRTGRLDGAASGFTIHPSRGPSRLPLGGRSREEGSEGPDDELGRRRAPWPYRNPSRPHGRDQGGGDDRIPLEGPVVAGTALATMALTFSSIGVVAQDEELLTRPGGARCCQRWHLHGAPGHHPDPVARRRGRGLRGSGPAIRRCHRDQDRPGHHRNEP